jgi:homoserine dehydrogenase
MIKLKIGLIGFGTVGTALIKRVQNNNKLVETRLGITLEIVSVLVKNKSKQRGVELAEGVVTDDVEAFFATDPQLVVEVVGGLGEVEDLVARSLASKIPVITANKELIAQKGLELFSKAESAGVDLYCEAAVAGGIPVVRVVRTSLLGEDIKIIAGILNGTCNFILTKMSDENMSYEEALKLAQDLGFAETDPHMDVSGKDSAAKIAILTSIALGRWITLEQVETKGIESISKEDIKSCKLFGYELKLIANTKIVDGNTINIGVSPTFVAKTNPLSAIKNENNAVLINGTTLGELTLSGPGAGGDPTATAVYGDLLDVAQKVIMNKQGDVLKVSGALDSSSIVEGVSKYYVSVKVKNEPGVLAKVAVIFGNSKISIQQISQLAKKDSALISLSLNECSKSDLDLCLEEIEKQAFTITVNSSYPILD